MKKVLGIFGQGIGLGLGLGLCLAGAVGLLYRALHGADPEPHLERATIFFLVVGGTFGLLGGWCLALKTVLEGLLSSLFLRIAHLVPMPSAAVTEEWSGKMEAFFGEVLGPMPSFFHKLVRVFLVSRFRDQGRINRALDRAKGREPQASYSPEWLSRAALHYFLEPLWLFFYGAYVILFLAACVFWSLAFIR